MRKLISLVIITVISFSAPAYALVSLQTGVTGKLPVASGGTGLTSVGANGTCLLSNGTANVYGSCAGSASANLGTSTSATSPQVTGDGTTGLYTAGAGLVDFSISGVKTLEVNSSGENLQGTLTTPLTQSTSSLTTNQATQGAGYFLPFNNPSSLSVGEGVSGTNIPANDTILYVSGGTATVSTTVPYATAANQYLIPVANSTGILVGMTATDTTTAGAINATGTVGGVYGNATGPYTLLSPTGTSGKNFITVSSGGTSCLPGMTVYDVTNPTATPAALTTTATAGSISTQVNLNTNLSANVVSTDTVTCSPTVILSVQSDNGITAGDTILFSPAVTLFAPTTGVIANGASITFTQTSSTMSASGLTTTGSLSTGVGGVNINGSPGVSLTNGVTYQDIPGDDTLVGYLAGANLSPADSLTTAVGYKALGSLLSTNSESTAFGYGAAQSLIKGGGTFFGINALGSCVYDCINEVAIGTDAMRNVVAGGSNVAIGADAMITYNGGQSVAIGANSVLQGGGTAATGSFNTAVGYADLSGTGMTSAAVSNTAIGALIAQNLTTGNNNTLVGVQADNSATTSFQNTCVGEQSCKVDSTGNDNTCVGANACDTETAAHNIVALGNSAAGKVTGNQEVYIGNGVGNAAGTSGAYNIVIGISNSADTPTTSTSNWFGIFGNSATPFISASGTGTPTTETMTLHGSTMVMPDLTSSTAAQTGSLCWSAAGLTYDGTNTCLVSSRKFKENINPLTDESGLREVMKLNPVSYYYKDKKMGGDKEQVGLIAEDVNDVDKRLVGFDDKGEVHSVKYENLTAILVKGMQEQQKEIDELKKVKYQQDGHRCYLVFWCKGII